MRYKPANWPEYNKNLINRGSIVFWFSEDVIKGWADAAKSSASSLKGCRRGYGKSSGH